MRFLYRKGGFSWKHFLKSYNAENSKILKQKGFCSLILHLRGIRPVNKQWIMKTYMNNFITQQNTFSTYVSLKEEENDENGCQSDGDNDMLVLNDNDDDESDEMEISEVKTSTNNCLIDKSKMDECKNGENIYDTNLVNKLKIHSQSCSKGSNISNTHLRKKNKYYSDNIVIYDNIIDLPSDLCTCHISEEEIEQINLGGYDLSLGEYATTIVYSKRVNK
ncbi:hypothetical protein, conserved [Plasmodium gonderi]|uniref:Uncharacterized protein n=1 Tax=Plasmodium gonderi TaxID=77519 RepID=A0A1Y1JNU2_PLAGO|nr:hypothetical protein, conserved [Plasmodium gonderi]GAW83125.1 hypothetical protein, conserved [Plasmodium gonderi]